MYAEDLSDILREIMFLSNQPNGEVVNNSVKPAIKTLSTRF